MPGCSKRGKSGEIRSDGGVTSKRYRHCKHRNLRDYAIFSDVVGSCSFVLDLLHLHASVSLAGYMFSVGRVNVGDFVFKPPGLLTQIIASLTFTRDLVHCLIKGRFQARFVSRMLRCHVPRFLQSVGLLRLEETSACALNAIAVLTDGGGHEFEGFLLEVADLWCTTIGGLCWRLSRFRWKIVLLSLLSRRSREGRRRIAWHRDPSYLFVLSPFSLLLPYVSGSATTAMAASAAAIMSPLGEFRSCVAQRLSRSSYTFHIALQLLQRLFAVRIAARELLIALRLVLFA
ncbi:hypothetical protein KC321_g39 [Hortaea werneckii]|nr:hypothetical protein KC321_g39 [Hortaea werneckii]